MLTLAARSMAVVAAGRWTKLGVPGTVRGVLGPAELAQDAGVGQWAGHPHDLAVRCCDDLQVHAVPVVLAGVERPVGGEAVDED